MVGTNTYITTENTNIDYIHQSITQSKDGLMDRVIRNNVNYDWHRENHTHQDFFDLVDLICEVMNSDRKYPYVINSANVSPEDVKGRFLQLRDTHINYVLECLRENTNYNGIKNIRAYKISCLYNAPLTMQTYWQQRANHDCYK